ncbi:MAG: serine hydrolase [Saprospiraceae bacterium]|nr:serine hydrolase [Saprospiraceae bacterium]
MKKYITKVITLILVFHIVVLQVHAQDSAESWASGTLKNMSLDEKIGQLFMIRAHSNLGKDHVSQIEKAIKKNKVGGLCFFQGTPQKQVELINKYQKLTKIPLMISMDAEWGLGMRHKNSAISFPKQLTLGAIQDNTMIYEMGRMIASQLKDVGVQVNFAPVVDVNNNPNNPVIHNRSFGEDMFNVATKSYAYMKGMQDEKVMACAKHFPGHGDTDVDSHKDLPILNHDRERLDSLELMPFRVMSQLGIMSMMSAHLSVPAIDDEENRPTSLSSKAINGILREELNFDGLVFTDALEMQGVAKHFETGAMEVEALKAGNDILLLPINLKKAIDKIKEAVSSGELSENEIDKKVLKILLAKHKLNLTRRQHVSGGTALDKKLNSNVVKAFKEKLYEKAVTLVKDDADLVPIKQPDNQKLACISIGNNKAGSFQNTIAKFGITKLIDLEKDFSIDVAKSTEKKLTDYETVIIGIHDMSIYKSRDFGISKAAFDLIYKLNSTKKVILVLFGSPYALQYFTDVPTILMGYENDDAMQKVMAQSLMGVTKIEGVLPVSPHVAFPVKSGLTRSGFFRLGYATPETVNINPDTLLLIDTLVQEMFDEEAAPGCQILAAKDGKIFFHKSYGYHTPDKKKKVKNDDVYDVASVTKILATTISLMKLYDEDKLNLYEPIKKYIPHLDTTNKGGLIIEDILAHQSGLPGWIAFYENTIDQESKSVKRLEEYFSDTPSDSFPMQICDKLYLRADWQDSIYNMIYNCDLRDRRDYKYSDLGFYLFHQLIEEVTQMPLEKYVEETFYRPMGLQSTLYNPLDKIDANRILPSEDDEYFRDRVVHGYVHDMGAAMLGGVSGHAGLFSSARDLAELLQMLLNGGSYAGKNYLKPSTVNKFARRYYKSTRRGLGFDMKELDEDKKLNMAEEASSNAFGHLGFTGISVFADPKHDLIYVFLSNRTFPSMKNYKFAKNSYRSRIQSVFYRAMINTRA